MYHTKQKHILFNFLCTKKSSKDCKTGTSEKKVLEGKIWKHDEFA